MKKILLSAVLVLCAAFLAAPALASVSVTNDLGGGYSEVVYYRGEEEKNEQTPERVEFYKDNALQVSKTYSALDDGTRRVDTHDAAGVLQGYALYKMEDGRETNAEYDAAGRMLSSTVTDGKTTVSTMNEYDLAGSLVSGRVVHMSQESDVVRVEKMDAAGNMLEYTLEMPGREDRLTPDGVLLGFTLHQTGEDGSYTDRYYSAKGELERFVVRATDKDGVTRVDEYDGAGTLQKYVLMRPENGYMTVETYDAAGALVSSEREEMTGN